MSKIVPRLNIFRKLPYIPLCMENFAKLVLIPCKSYFYETKRFPSLWLTNISLFKLLKLAYRLWKGFIPLKHEFDLN